jgi:hypothetical protein
VILWLSPGTVLEDSTVGWIGRCSTQLKSQYIALLFFQSYNQKPMSHPWLSPPSSIPKENSSDLTSLSSHPCPWVLIWHLNSQSVGWVPLWPRLPLGLSYDPYPWLCLPWYSWLFILPVVSAPSHHFPLPFPQLYSPFAWYHPSQFLKASFQSWNHHFLWSLVESPLILVSDFQLPTCTNAQWVVVTKYFIIWINLCTFLFKK